MVIEATQLEKDCLQKNRDCFQKDVEWLEGLIDFILLNEKNDLCSGLKVPVTYGIDMPYSEYGEYVVSSTYYNREFLVKRRIPKENFEKALKILQEKYKQYKWLISLKIVNSYYKRKAIYIQRVKMKKSKSFWKSLFSKRKRTEKDYSVLTEMEKKYL